MTEEYSVMKNSRKLLATAFAATMLGALAVSTPASAWHRWGWGYVEGYGWARAWPTDLALGSAYPGYYGYYRAAYPRYYGYRRCYRYR